MTMLRALAGAAVLGATLLAGCAVPKLEPWVKPYERERLADPIMKLWLQLGRRSDSGGDCSRCSAACSACLHPEPRAQSTCRATRRRR